MHAVLPGEGGEAEIRYDKPLRRAIAVVAFLVAGGGFARAGLRQHHVESRFQLAHRLQHREGGHDILVEVGRGVERAGPDFHRVRIRQLPRAIGAELAQKIIRADGRQKIAVADAQDVHGDLGGVDRDDGNALLPDAGQDEILAGEMDLGRTVLDVDLIVAGFQQVLADRGRQALAHHHGIAFAMLQTLDADLLLLVGDGGIGRAGHRDEGREIDPTARQRLGELEAGARRGGIIVDLVVENAEAVFFAQFGVGGAHGLRVHAVERCLVGVERKPPELLPGVEFAEQVQRGGFLRRRRRALIGVVAGGIGVLLELVGV